MTKINLVQKPFMLPRKCLTCGSGSSDRKFIDFGVQVSKPFGRLYLCTACAKEVAELCGFVPKQELAVAESKYVKMRGFYRSAVAKIRELEDVVSSLRRLDASSDSPVRNLVSSNESLSGTAEGERRADREPTKSSASGKSERVSKTAGLFDFSTPTSS